MAEIRQKIISCSQGHYYDANRYDQCPYCSAGGFSPTIDPFAAGESKPGSTVGPLIPGDVPHHAGGVQVGGFTPTIDPNQPGGLSERMGKTQYVDASTPAGTPAPVVGWLVAVEGPCRGTDYRIHTGYNYIGREAGDICIRGDSTISAQRDANVTYVPQTREFYIAHELGKNVTAGQRQAGDRRQHQAGKLRPHHHRHHPAGLCGPVRGAVCLGQRGAGA